LLRLRYLSVSVVMVLVGCAQPGTSPVRPKYCAEPANYGTPLPPEQSAYGRYVANHAVQQDSRRGRSPGRVLSPSEYAQSVRPDLTGKRVWPRGTSDMLERGYATYLMRMQLQTELDRTRLWAEQMSRDEPQLDEDVLQWAEMLLAFLEADLPSDPMLTREEFTRRIYPGPPGKVPAGLNQTIDGFYASYASWCAEWARGRVSPPVVAPVAPSLPCEKWPRT